MVLSNRPSSVAASSAAGSAFPEGERKKFGSSMRLRVPAIPGPDVQEDPPVRVGGKVGGCRPCPFSSVEVRVAGGARGGTPPPPPAARAGKERARTDGMRALPVDRSRFRCDQPWEAIVVIVSTTWAVSTVGEGKISVKLAWRFW